jgi:hypothetical protein
VLASNLFPKNAFPENISIYLKKERTESPRNIEEILASRAIASNHP